MGYKFIHPKMDTYLCNLYRQRISLEDYKKLGISGSPLRTRIVWLATRSGKLTYVFFKSFKHVHIFKNWTDKLTGSLSCLENPMNSMKRQKDRTLKDELSRSVGAQYATGDQWRNNSRKDEEMEPKQKQHPVVDVTGDRSKVQCCKEQYCIGTWNVRSMNQGKLEVVKREMARVNVNILWINKLKWNGMGDFNSDDHYIYYCGQESLRRNGVVSWSSRESKMQYLDAISKTTEWSLFFSKANHSISL